MESEPLTSSVMNLKDYLNAGYMKGKTLARAIGVTPVLVSQWANGVRRVPAERCPQIERATNSAVRCEDLRPDVDWAVLRGTAAETAARDSWATGTLEEDAA